MSFMRQFWNTITGKKEFIENANGTVKDLNDYETVEISVKTEELPLPDLEEYPHLTAYVKDRNSGFIDATIVLTKEGEFGVAFTALSEPKIDKKYGRRLALYRAINDIDLKTPNRRGNYYVKGKEFTKMSDALYAEMMILSERAQKYFRWEDAAVEEASN